MNGFKYFTASLLFPGLVLMASACSEENLEVEANASDGVRIGASVNNMKQSRAIENKKVETGTYFLSFYPVANYSELTTTTVSFNAGVGYPSYNGRELKWTDIAYSDAKDKYSKEGYVFFLDNVPDSYANSRFNAGLLTEENDLLWATDTTTKLNENETVHFVLEHCMSAFYLKVKLDNVTDERAGYNNLDLSKATIKLKYLIRTAGDYDRTTGNISLENYNYDENGLVLMAPDVDNLKWVSEDVDEEGYQQTQVFVLPPQYIYGKRPRLEIEVPYSDATTPGSKLFTGAIPDAMYVENANGSQTVRSMAFLRGYKMELKVKLSNEEDDLMFMPVTLVDWVYEGDFTMTADKVKGDEENSDDNGNGDETENAENNENTDS